MCVILKRVDLSNVRPQTSVEYHADSIYPAKFDFCLYLPYLTWMSRVYLIILNQTKICIWQNFEISINVEMTKHWILLAKRKRNQ